MPTLFDDTGTLPAYMVDIPLISASIGSDHYTLFVAMLSSLPSYYERKFYLAKKFNHL